MAILHHSTCFSTSSSLKLVRSLVEDGRRGGCRVQRRRVEVGIFTGRRIGRAQPVYAQGENSESISGKLTEQEARSLLGVSEETPFDDVVKVKNRLLLSAVDKEEKNEINRAYDLLLMKSMTKRVQGSEDVPSNVRFADVQKRDMTKEARKILSKIPTGGIAIENPKNEVLRANSIVLGVLALSIIPQGVSPLTETYDAIPGLQLALAFVWSVYAFRQYRMLGLGKAVGYTFIGLAMGGIVGGALESVLHVQQHPIGGFHSPVTMISEFSLLGIWTCATFLA